MVLWGSKTSPSLTLSSINMSDRKLQLDGKIYRDPSPRPTMTTQLAQERVSSREEDWRRERDMEKRRERARSNDIDPRERYYQTVRATAPRWREGEREWMEREGRQAEDKSIHTRALMNVQKHIEREMERGIKKGETFPRMANSYGDHGRRKMSDATHNDDRWERKKRDRQKQIEIDDWERAREREWLRERRREGAKDEIYIKATEEGKSTGRRPVQDNKLQHRERYNKPDYSIEDKRREVGDSRDRRERYAARNRDMGGREGTSLSPYRQTAREIDTDRSEREKAQKSGRSRDTRSDGDSVEREFKRERVRVREKENSKSEGENNSKRVWEGDRDRQGYKEDNGQRYRDRQREVDRSRRREEEKAREGYRDAEKREGEGGKRRERREDLKGDRALLKDREDYERRKEYRQRKNRKEREADLSLDDATGIRSLNMTVPRLLPGEWGCDMPYRGDRGGYEEREPGRHGTNTNKRQIKNKRSEKHESDKEEPTGSMPVHRRMWLEPHRDKNSKDEISDRERYKLQRERRREEESTESRTKWVREGRKDKQDPDEQLDQRHHRGRNRERTEYRGQTDRETEGVSVDGDDVDEVLDTGDEKREHLSDGNGWLMDRRTTQRDDTEENVAEEDDREEEGGREYFTTAGSETGWKLKNNQLADYFIVSSGEGDEEAREEDEDEEFQDRPGLGERSHNSTSPVDLICESHEEKEKELTMGEKEKVDEEKQETEKQPTYVFCVIGQTLPRPQPGDASPSQVDQARDVEKQNPEFEKCNSCSDDATQQPQDDLHLTQSRNDEYKEDEVEQYASKEARPAAGETAGADTTNTSPAVLQDTEPAEDTRSKVEYSRPGIKESSRDSQTERLLVQWRGKNNEVAEERRDQPSPEPSNPYAHVRSEVNLEEVLDEIHAGGLGSTEKIQMGKGWTMSEEPKRHSQAPHLKWAKNVVRDILGHSEEETVDEPNSLEHGDTHEDELAQGTKEIPFIMLTASEQDSDPELPEENSLEELRGMQQRRGGTHSEQFRAFCDDTLAHTHSDTLLNTEGKEDDSVDKETGPSGLLQLEKPGLEVKITCDAGNGVVLEQMESEGIGQREAEMYLSVDNTLYKPNSCPSLNCNSTTETLNLSREGKNWEVEDRMGESEEEIQGEEPEGRGNTAEVAKTEAGGLMELGSKQGEVVAERDVEVGTQISTSSFREADGEAGMLRGGIRRTAERRDDEPAEEESHGRDRRTRIFSTTDDEEDCSKSWGGTELMTYISPFSRQKRKSKFFKRAQLYQQYNEAAQNLEILSQSGSPAHRLLDYLSHSPAPSPPPACRPLPPLPPVLHPHSIGHISSFSTKSLSLPDPPDFEGRPPSPRLSVSFSQSPVLWRDLPGVRNNCELEQITETQKRLQEVQFEVVTSEASYCRSLDIVVEHFVKSKQLGALLSSQDRNWLFSRLSDVRAISHSFLTKLEERVESDVMHFTVCDIIAQHCPRFKKVYVPYLTNQSYQDATYQRLMNKNPVFKRTVEKLERNPVCERLPFRSFLVLPFQRITRIKLLVQNIVKRTTPGTTEATQAIRAMKLLERLIQESNESISQMKNIESLVSLNAKVDFECKTLPLVSQSRRLIREGPVTELMDFSLKDTERNAYLHLFNDFLLVSLQKEGGRFTVIDHSPVKELRGENCRVKLHTLQKNLFRLHTANRSLLLRTETQSEKLRWLSALSRPYPEVDFSAAQDLSQMQCIRTFVAQQPDELSLDKADIILVHEKSDNWVEGTRLPDRHRGWVPESNLETITNLQVKERNLLDALKLTTVTAAM